jgi:hypothetical protein
MIANAGLAAEHHVVADFHATRYAGLGRDQTVPADQGVVCDLHEVVDLGAFTDDCIAVGPTVDRSIRSDFNVVLDDDPAILRDFLMTLRTR